MKNSIPTWINKIKLVAWDLDGTLYPFNADLNQLIEDEKYKTIAHKLGVTETVAHQKFSELYQQLKSNTKVLKQLGIDGEQFFIDFWQRLDLHPYLSPNPALANALADLTQQRHLQQVIVTNSNTDQTVTKKLNLLGISPQVFSQMYTSVKTGFIKPDNRVFQLLLDRHQLQPDQILYIGDREETDIKPAHQIGMRTAIVTYQPSTEKLTTADLSVVKPLEICDLFTN